MGLLKTWPALAFITLCFSGCGEFSSESFESSNSSNGSAQDEEFPLGPRMAIDLSQPITERLLMEAKEENVTTIIRYYDHENETIRGKTIRNFELDLLKKHNLNLAVVFQHNNNRLSSFTRQRGDSDSDRSLYLARLIQQPVGSAIYIGVDGSWGTTATQWNAVRGYFEVASPKIRNAGYKMGVYGSGLICRLLRDEGLVDFCWLGAATAWPEYQDLLDSNTWAMVQYLPTAFAGHEVDFNDINPSLRDFGQFRVR